MLNEEARLFTTWSRYGPADHVEAFGPQENVVPLSRSFVSSIFHAVSLSNMRASGAERRFTELCAG
ncbi:MAG: hypothetical protein L0G99_18425 [Propionibacteriales bacterium]|nr:hypothetical protein [Propionibacteriales bacterium]